MKPIKNSSSSVVDSKPLLSALSTSSSLRHFLAPVAFNQASYTIVTKAYVIQERQKANELWLFRYFTTAHAQYVCVTNKSS